MFCAINSLITVAIEQSWTMFSPKQEKQLLVLDKQAEATNQQEDVPCMFALAARRS
jgi:hypothetical protein